MGADEGSTDWSPTLAIMGDYLLQWPGGRDLLRFSASALNSIGREGRLTVFLAARHNPWLAANVARRIVKKCLGRTTVPIGSLPRTKLLELLRAANVQVRIADYSGSPARLAREMKRRGVDSLLYCGVSLGPSFPFAWVGYISDLQHRRMPQWFSKDEICHRDRWFSQLLEDAPAVMVTSNAVAEDIKEYYPSHRARVMPLPYAPPTNRIEISDASVLQARAKYHLPAQYVLISNQFWVHKDHETAFIALRKVRDAGHDIQIVCTGDIVDYRWPDHFSNVQRTIATLSLEGYVQILGLVPKHDQFAIMQGALGVIQPTLFEGAPGGGSVSEAISLNKPCIVSDIPINREIDLGVVTFFKAGSGEDLAWKIGELLISPPVMPTKEETFLRLSKRQEEYGRRLLQTATVAAEASHTR